MYDGSPLLENRIELSFFGAFSHVFSEEMAFDGERLPYETFLGASKGGLTVFSRGKETILHAGEVMLIPCDTDFSVKAESGSGLLQISADYRVYTNLRVFSLFDLPGRLEDKTGELFETCQNVVRLVLENQFTNYRLENALELKLLLYRLALFVVRKSYPKKESNMVMARFERLSPVLFHINEKLDSSCPIGELSDIMGLSEDAFYRYFKSTIGSSPKEYLISERLRRARILLAGSNMSVTDISKSCGYDNPFYFSTLFHGKYGFSPSAYREKTAALMALLT